MSTDNQQDLLEYLIEASKTVSDWPAWKQSGSDATQFQETQQSKSHYARESACFAPKRTVTS
ncbi:hypothetical protein [Yersinia proxima]|uniref:hypothetical protein n=1 Tax=Yersinia proxima TaxID=2890316 RepID=UPI00098743A0|nr:hypothetical protein [Yersinia proxima]